MIFHYVVSSGLIVIYELATCMMMPLTIFNFNFNFTVDIVMLELIFYEQPV